MVETTAQPCPLALVPFTINFVRIVYRYINTIRPVMRGENRKLWTVAWFYPKQHEEGWGTSKKSRGRPLFPILLFLCSLSHSHLGVLTSCPLLRPRLPVGEAKGETGRAKQQIWQLNQHQRLVCLNSRNGEQQAPAAGIRHPVFHTHSSREEKAAWDGRCFFQEQRG